jgi:hypothetical protein
MFKLTDWLFEGGPFEGQTPQRVCVEELYVPGDDGARGWLLFYSDGSVETLEVRGK